MEARLVAIVFRGSLRDTRRVAFGGHASILVVRGLGFRVVHLTNLTIEHSTICRRF